MAEIRATKENSIVQTSNSSPVLTVVGHESHTEYGVIVNSISALEFSTSAVSPATTQQFRVPGCSN